MSDAKPRTPSDLGAGGKKFFRDVVGTYDLDAHEVRVLTEAARTVDELDRVRKALEEAPSLVAKGSMGQAVEHPLLGSLRNHRATLQKLLATLALPDSEGGAPQSAAQRLSQRGHDGRWASQRDVRSRQQAADRLSRGAS
ncbi:MULTISPECIES: hypothetical protein [Pseudonocardia]|uniref:Phage terminase, small subunit n=2 Tax=Pseudonocardia TaxID=1847 RepID=A0A1Y2N7X9_PSEAH|nr:MULTISPECIES: hypothetical protein [Pseudonocardia]OSY43566.1 hypothetical protein BG845_00509 [Pseudonocardia autotrophica]TDN73443.1 hypothetical protein C8E95_2540 [Pseudonocardia autotrophica]BBG04182.1 hypothetical protein Pdca_53910 [Pseudonocardia autotrophica]GEC25513.1 hypothetical protein PSA01_25420 [Pseudonocardia saturnea]